MASEQVAVNGTRSTSQNREHPHSRPSTPLRSTSRASVRARSLSRSREPTTADDAVTVAFEPALSELADSVADLESNFILLHELHESLARFNESFAGFLYGMNMNAFCVDFNEAPIPESFQNAKQRERMRDHHQAQASRRETQVGDETFMTDSTVAVLEDTPAKRAPPRPQSGIPGSRGGRGSTRQSGLPTMRGRGAPTTGRSRGRGRGQTGNRGG